MNAHVTGDAGPEPTSRSEREAFNDLVSSSLSGVRESAQAWRNGLAALVSLISAGLVIKGRSIAGDVVLGWRVAITSAIGLGLAAAIFGLWQALAAEAGSDVHDVSLDAIHRDYPGGVAAYRVAMARRVGRRLRTARRSIGVSLIMLFAAIVISWWAPLAHPNSPAIVIIPAGSNAACGRLVSADHGKVRLKVGSSGIERVFPLSAVENMKVVGTCPLNWTNQAIVQVAMLSYSACNCK